MATAGMREQWATEVQTCDVCVVGAGSTGLNALFAASRYLSCDQRVILIDRRKAVGTPCHAACWALHASW